MWIEHDQSRGLDENELDNCVDDVGSVCIHLRFLVDAYYCFHMAAIEHEGWEASGSLFLNVKYLKTCYFNP